MPDSDFIIRNSALLLGGLCLLGCLPLCLLTPEGALFLFVNGCCWLGLSMLATGRETTTSNTKDSGEMLPSRPS